MYTPEQHSQQRDFMSKVHSQEGPILCRHDKVQSRSAAHPLCVAGCPTIVTSGTTLIAG